MIGYSWKTGSRIKADPEKVGKELESILEVTPEKVLAKAKNKNSAMHQCFTWEDTEAAHKWRLEEARHIVKALVILEPVDNGPQAVIQVRAFEHITLDDRPVYMPIDKVLENDDWREQVFYAIRSGIEQLQRKAKAFEHRDKRLIKVGKQLGLAAKAIDNA